MINIKLTIAYDGTSFFGWQKNNIGPSIEAELEKALTQILQHPVILQAASRTDAGVHASGQVVNFMTNKPDLSLDKLMRGVNALLPSAIVVRDIEQAPVDFHPTLHCIGKEYHYHLCYGMTQMPRQRLYAWHFPSVLNVDIMRCAIPMLVGKRDFASFCNAKKKEEYDNYVRQLYRLTVCEIPLQCLRIEVVGDSFLYKMVRNLIGTLVYLGCGKLALEDLPFILESSDRTLAGITAPAHGLFLEKVTYGDTFPRKVQSNALYTRLTPKPGLTLLPKWHSGTT